MKGRDIQVNLAELETPNGEVRNEAVTLAWGNYHNRPKY